MQRIQATGLEDALHENETESPAPRITVHAHVEEESPLEAIVQIQIDGANWVGAEADLQIWMGPEIVFPPRVGSKPIVRERVELPWYHFPYRTAGLRIGPEGRRQLPIYVTLDLRPYGMDRTYEKARWIEFDEGGGGWIKREPMRRYAGIQYVPEGDVPERAQVRRKTTRRGSEELEERSARVELHQERAAESIRLPQPDIWGEGEFGVGQQGYELKYRFRTCCGSSRETIECIWVVSRRGTEDPVTTEQGGGFQANDPRWIDVTHTVGGTTGDRVTTVVLLKVLNDANGRSTVYRYDATTARIANPLQWHKLTRSTSNLPASEMCPESASAGPAGRL